MVRQQSLIVFSQKFDYQAILRIFLCLLGLFVLLTEVLQAIVIKTPSTIEALVSWPLSQLLVALLLIPLVTYSHHLPEKQASPKLLLQLGTGVLYGVLLHVFSAVAILLLERLLKLPEHYQAGTFISQVGEQWILLFYYALLFWAQLALLELHKARLLLETERKRNLRLNVLNQEGNLASLRYRLNPHFLFNSLNNISMVVRKGEQNKAIDSIVSLREILSKTMDKDQRPFIRLSEELELIRHFIEIEKLRNEAREIEIEVDEPALKLKVPALFIQPIVENAFKFAAESGSHPPRITIKAAQRSDRLNIIVFNSGSHFPLMTVTGGAGLGLMSTIHRLRYLYGTNFTFTSRDHREGVEIEIDIPAAK